MPTSDDDWVWLHKTVPSRLREFALQKFLVVIFTNQNNILLQDGRLNDFTCKMNSIADELDITLVLYVAPLMNEFRKPATGMWDALLADYNITGKGIDEGFFVGDGAGRQGDRDDSDK
ncbi:MAG: hypothetical protein M1821_007412 [Bathelium mastoideum]|nr:MAG: hypothetical protein M1821_007412 [Bathelium mastoideum]